jgi:uncharacterized repeat protein (TIGR01451 family)
VGYYPGLRFRPANNGLYFWDAPASLAVPAKDSYTTKITWGDKTPATELYGYDLGDTILGSGNPGDQGVQYGLNIAVVDKAKDGSSGKIVVWNAKALESVSIEPNKTTVAAGATVRLQVVVKNTTPLAQTFTITSPIPAGTTYVDGGNYDAVKNAIVWTGKVNAGTPKILTFTVMVNKGTAPGSIPASVNVADDALGATATTTITVK